MNQALEIHTPDRVNVAPVAMTPMDMLNHAVERGADITVLEKLMGLQERWEAAQNRKAFDAAMSAAKAEIPVIAKNRQVGFESKRGGTSTSYRHEDLGEIARTVDPILAKHGLSYRFRPKQADGRVEVTCILSHRDGHCEESTLAAGHDNTGNKNSIQAVGSTVTYLQRYTLKMALGLAASADDDGKATDAKPEENGPISEEQAETLRRLIAETGTDIEQFCKFGNVGSIPEIGTADFPKALALLETKKRRMQP